LTAVVVGGLAAGLLVARGGRQVVVPESPAKRAGLTESEFIAQTSLSEKSNGLVTPVAAVDAAGHPLSDSPRIISALRAKDGRTVTLPEPTIVDFGHLVAGIYVRPGAIADRVSDFPDFFRTINPGETGQLTLSDGQWYVARYVMLPAHVPIDVVGFRFTSDPHHPPATLAVPAGNMPGAFLSSDPTLTRIWYSAASTMQLSMMTTTPDLGYQLFDSPERDRSEWLWYDASADNTASYAFGRLALAPALNSYEAATFGPGRFVVSPSDGIPDQNGFTERDLASLYNFSSEPSILTRFYSSLVKHEATVTATQIQPDGMYRTNILPVPPTPVNPAKMDAQSLETELWDYAGFLGMARLADVRRDQPTAATYERKALLLKAAVNRNLWDDSKGAFVDFVGSTHVDEAGNSMAVIYGLATAEQAQRILSYLHSHNDRIYDWNGSGTWGAINPAGSTDLDRPFLPGDPDLNVADWSAPYTQWGWGWGMGSNPDDFTKQYNYNYSLVPWAEAFEVQADFIAGEDAAGIDLIDRAWGTMLSRGPSTFYEGSRYDGTPGYELGSQHSTVVHRWAAGVGALLQRYILGVDPVTPGFRSWRIEPHGGSLAWAQGRVPTPEGPLSAWWQWNQPETAHTSYVMVVSAPNGTTGEVSLPLPERGVVVLDNMTVFGSGINSASAHWNPKLRRIEIEGLGPGDHVIRWTPTGITRP
jgi:hypothetical protein